MNLGRALVRMAIVVAIIGVLTWLLLVNDVFLGPWLLALLVLAHGWVHLMFVFPKPESPNPDGSEYPFDFGHSWLIGKAGLNPALVRSIGLVSMVVVFALSVATALATVGILVPSEWWGALMIATAASSTLMLVIFYSPALILGFAINAAMVALVLSGTWTPA